MTKAFEPTTSTKSPTAKSATNADHLLRADEEKAQRIFQKHVGELLKELEDELKTITDTELELEPEKIRNREIAFRSTLLSRLFSSLTNIYNNPIEDRKNNDPEGLKETIERNKSYIRFTNHPTEGQNFETIKAKFAIMKITTNLARVLESGKVTAAAIVGLRRIMLNYNDTSNPKLTLIENWLAHKTIPSIEEFERISKEVRQDIISDFVHQPLHHVEKMKVGQEIDLTLFHMDRCRKEMAKLSSRFPGTVDVDDVRFSSWAGDMDGKPHINPGHGLIFEHRSQMKFFETLNGYLEDAAIEVNIEGQKEISQEIASIISDLKEIREYATRRIIVGEDLEQLEKTIMERLISLKEETNIHHLDKIINYVKNSGCRTAKVGFSTREEIDKTNETFLELATTCLTSSPTLLSEFSAVRPDLASEISRITKSEKKSSDQIKEIETLFTDLNHEEDDPTKPSKREILTKFFLQNASNPAVGNTIAANINKLSDNSRRQLLCAMEGMAMHPRHEHVISQFDCDKESYIATLALFEMAKHFPYAIASTTTSELNASRAYLQEYYQKGPSKVTGSDLYQQLFSPEAAYNTAQSMVELSPLAEENHTIPRIAAFTREILEDQEITDYVRTAGGIFRETRSNSDGSAALGAHEVVIRHLEADIAVKRMAREEGLDPQILQGIGANDLERMAPWNLYLTASQFTAQGGDAQHQTASRMMSMLLRKEDSSEKDWLKIREKDATKAEELISFYHKLHNRSEIGFTCNIENKEVSSAALTHRGVIPGAVVAALGKLSSRPDARKGATTEKSQLHQNTPDQWDKSVYNPSLRRIGAISLQRASGLSTFCLAPFFESTDDFDQELVSEFTKIPAIRNINFSAIFALGIADTETFAVNNGFQLPPSTEARNRADQYKGLLTLLDNLEATKSRTEDKKTISALETEIRSYREKHHLENAEDIRHAHMCYQIDGCRHVLRNALTPFINKSSAEAKEKINQLFRTSEDFTITDYGKLVNEACQIMASDPAQEKETRDLFFCIGKQINMVRSPDGFYESRKTAVIAAHNALEKGDSDAFGKAIEQISILTRSSGNPASPAGMKNEERIKFFIAMNGEQKEKTQTMMSRL